MANGCFGSDRQVARAFNDENNSAHYGSVIKRMKKKGYKEHIGNTEDVKCFLEHHPYMTEACIHNDFSYFFGFYAAAFKSDEKALRFMHQNMNCYKIEALEHLRKIQARKPKDVSKK